MRSHARRSNPLARGIFIRPDGNFLLRQRCAPMRSSRSGNVSWPYVDAPLVGKHDFERRAACGSGTVVCPASRCSHFRPRACMVFVRSDPNRLRELQCSSAKNWFFRPCLTDRLPLLCSPSCPHLVGTIANACRDAPCSCFPARTGPIRRPRPAPSVRGSSPR